MPSWVNPGSRPKEKERVAKAQAAQHQAESTKESDARRKREAEAQATKRQSETSQNVEKRRHQDSQAKKRYIARLCIYMTPLLIHTSSFKPGNMIELETEQARQSGGNKRVQQRNSTGWSNILLHKPLGKPPEFLLHLWRKGLTTSVPVVTTWCTERVYLNLRSPTTPKHQQNLQQCLCTSAKNKVEICTTCDYTLRQGRVPSGWTLRTYQWSCLT